MVLNQLLTQHHVGKARAVHDQVARAFGKQVRDRRVQLGLSIDRAAVLAGMSWTGWKNLEEGSSPTVLTWFKAAEVLGWDLFIETEEKEC